METTTEANGITKSEPETKPESPPVVLTREELLEVENLALRAQTVSQRKELFVNGAQRQIDEFDAQLTELRGKITQAQVKLATKYGIDFTKQQIESDTGRIIAAPPAKGK